MEEDHLTSRPQRRRQELAITCYTDTIKVLQSFRASAHIQIVCYATLQQVHILLVAKMMKYL